MKESQTVGVCRNILDQSEKRPFAVDGQNLTLLGRSAPQAGRHIEEKGEDRRDDERLPDARASHHETNNEFNELRVKGRTVWYRTKISGRVLISHQRAGGTRNNLLGFLTPLEVIE